MMIIAGYLTILFIYVYFSDPRAPRLDSILATVTEKVVRPNNFFVVFITRASTHRRKSSHSSTSVEQRIRVLV